MHCCGIIVQLAAKGLETDYLGSRASTEIPA